MSSKAILIRDGLAFKMTVAGIVLFSWVAAPAPALAQAASDGGTTSIQHGSDAEKALKMQEPSYQTREERLNAKPLDWNSTIGKPKPRALTAAERKPYEGPDPNRRRVVPRTRAPMKRPASCILMIGNSHIADPISRRLQCSPNCFFPDERF